MGQALEAVQASFKNLKSNGTAVPLEGCFIGRGASMRSDARRCAWQSCTKKATTDNSKHLLRL